MSRKRLDLPNGLDDHVKIEEPVSAERCPETVLMLNTLIIRVKTHLGIIHSISVSQLKQMLKCCRQGVGIE